ncbi:MAG: YciI family protein [Planctomycetota bacterium]
MAEDRLPTHYALIWRSEKTDDQFDAAEFEARIPRLMQWLGGLHASGHLVACGGGGFENHSGGLTIVRAASVDEALELAQASPMNEIGSTELLVWDTYFADLSVPREF